MGKHTVGVDSGRPRRLVSHTHEAGHDRLPTDHLVPTEQWLYLV